MRLPHPQLESLCFSFETATDLIRAIGDKCSLEEAREIKRLVELGLPPVTSRNSLSVMFGYNPGFIWSLLNRTPHHYRRFSIPKGRGMRKIDAPRVALKGIQKWLSYHFQEAIKPAENVFGFVPNRSHLDAAAEHLLAEWVFSVDIENFFPSVSYDRVYAALSKLGYQSPEALGIVSALCTLNSSLVQGAPTSPVLSNIVLGTLDAQLAKFAEDHGLIFTRYADDIVFSGSGAPSEELLEAIKAAVVADGWRLATRKVELSVAPRRLKVHGLLVHGKQLRLTKGYRNRIRAYKHLMRTGKISNDDIHRIRGHLNYADQVDKYG